MFRHKIYTCQEQSKYSAPKMATFYLRVGFPLESALSSSKNKVSTDVVWFFEDLALQPDAVFVFGRTSGWSNFR